MNSTEAVYSVCILIALVAANAGLLKLKRVLKRYGCASCTKSSAR